MDFFGIVEVMVRRWRTAIPVFLIGIAITIRVAAGVGTEYQSYGTVVILPAPARVVELGSGELYTDRSNPYLNAGITRTLARVLSILIGASDVRVEAVDSDLSPTYVIELDDTEPILFITAKGSSPEQSSDTLDFLLVKLSGRLEELQGLTPDTPREERAEMEILSDSRARVDSSASVKVLGSLLVVVILVTTMATFATEGLADRRRRESAMASQ